MATILIAEDDIITRHLLELNLQDEGYEVTGVANGEEALAQLQTDLADVMMPKLDGYALCQACKSDPQRCRIPIILYSSSFTRDQEQQLGYDFGADRYLLKPIDPQTLSMTIAQLLAEASQNHTRPAQISVDKEMQRLKVYNEVLFDKLSKKMQELEHQVERLRRSEETLKTTQAQLIQNEKMATLGLLSAGIAHEINTPLSYIASNLNTLKRYAKDFTDFFSTVAEGLQKQTGFDDAGTLTTLIEQRKLDLTSKDILDLIDDSIDGTDRLKSIVLNLKSFCRQDDLEKTAIDLNDLLEKTVNIAHCELKYRATVEFDFEDLPPYRCFPQQLGQVFLNLIVNAAQAMENQGSIILKSRVNEGNILIGIHDTGSGMSQEVKENIFEPFFTTKPVGCGTGLGLSISADIIQHHGGTITVDSTLGKGTQFLITLPVMP